MIKGLTGRMRKTSDNMGSASGHNAVNGSNGPTAHTGARQMMRLTQAQEGLWYGQSLDPQNPIYNTGEYIEIRGPLDVARFTAAINQVMAEADAVALQLQDLPQGPVQWVNEKQRPQLQLIDLRGEVDPVATAKARMDADMNTPLDLARDALTAQRLYQLADDHFYWYERIHHLLTDAWGQSLINTHVAALYRGDADRQPLTPYDIWLSDDAAYRDSAKEKDDASYWHQVFEQTPMVADLTFGHGEVAITADTAIRIQDVMPDAFEQHLAQLCERDNLAWPDVLTALAAAYICRHTANSETVIGVPHMGRMGQACARIPATVMNVLPLRVVVQEEKPLTAFLLDVTRQLRQVRRHGRYRSEQLRRDLGLLGGHKRLYGPSVNILPFDCAQLDLPGLQTIRHTLGNGPVEDLTITFRADALGRGIRIELDANPQRYSQMDVRTHMQRLMHFLSAALNAQTLAQVPTLTPVEAKHWVCTCNNTAHDVPQTTLVHLMAQRWEQTPQAMALSYEGIQLTYAQLEAITRQMAQRMRQAGVGPGDLVAVALPRSLELVLALVAVLRAGAAYLPLDVEYPAERIATIVHAASPRLALSHASTRHILPGDLPVWPLSWPFDAADYACSANTADIANIAAGQIDAPQPHDAAYVIYTSGSTGTPKGVVIEHDAIVNRLLWMQQHYGIGADERILQKTPATFDVSVWEFFLPLISGATLVIAPPLAHKDPQQLARLMQQGQITTLHFVPSMLSIFLAQLQILLPQSQPDFSRLRRVFCSGEALPAELRDRFHATLGGPDGAQLHNLYGPTEAAVDVSYWDASFHDHSPVVPIGFPVWNTQLYVLDKYQRPVPPDVVGHLYLGGRQLARGYLGRDDLTQERFITNPFIPSERMYATGDLARWREDGAVIFLGRSDFQIKIRGQRVELEEIETQLGKVDGVSQVAVIVREDQPGDQRIVAYVACRKGAALSEDVLRQTTLAHLPDYMVPSAFVILPELPVTANGKLDRNALPAPVWAQHGGKTPVKGTEQAVAALFVEILGLHEPVYADDDFFALGGHSLLAAQLMLNIRSRWGHAIGLGALFEHPTVAQLASYLDELNQQQHSAGQEGFGEVLYLHKVPNEHNGQAQRRALFCIHPAGGLGWCYGTLARHINPERNVIGLQSPALDVKKTFPGTLTEMARRYVDTMINLQPQGPYHLLGWSVGGIIAQAMAAELQSRGLPVGVVAMLDAYPSDCWRSEEEMPEDAALKALLHIAGHDPKQMSGVEMTRESVVGFLRRSGHPLGYLSDAMLEGIIRVVDGNNRLVRGHQHRRYDGTALHFRAALDHQGKNLYPRHWAPYVGTLDVHDVPALHGHLVAPESVEIIAPVLNEALLKMDELKE